MERDGDEVTGETHGTVISRNASRPAASAFLKLDVLSYCRQYTEIKDYNVCKQGSRNSTFLAIAIA